MDVQLTFAGCFDQNCHFDAAKFIAYRKQSDEAVNIVVVILPGRVEGKENGDFHDKFRSGSIFSIDRVDAPCGEICEQVTIYMVAV